MNSELREFLEAVAALTGVFFVIGSVGANETGSIGDAQLFVQCLIGFAVALSGIPAELAARKIAQRKSRKANAKKRGKAA